jgi:hypothetical protein
VSFFVLAGCFLDFQMRQAGAPPMPSKTGGTLQGLAGAVNLAGEKFCISAGGGAVAGSGRF